jgi:hypothetical protein
VLTVVPDSELLKDAKIVSMKVNWEMKRKMNGKHHGRWMHKI